VVYVIGSSTNPVKIGIAANLTKRLASLQIANPDPLYAHYAVRCPPRLAREIEQAAHKKFKDHHRRGEWFNIEAKTAFVELEKIAAEILSTNRELADDWGDAISQIAMKYPLDGEVRSALAYYKDQASKQKGVKFVARAQAHILKQTSPVDLNIFRVYVEEGGFGFLQSPTVKERSHAGLAKALNALADYVAHVRQKALFQQISVNFA
jgi:Meiotically up-regulated gene 113